MHKIKISCYITLSHYTVTKTEYGEIMKEVGIYVHIPFCKSKCNYCDFTSFCGKDELIKKYIENLKIEIEERCSQEYLVKSIFIGGGTPSYIDGKYIEEILQTIKEHYKVSENAEISIEINPRNNPKRKM